MAHILTTHLPNPLRTAPVAALLFTGTTRSLLSTTQLASAHEHATRLTIDRNSRTDIGMPPGPPHPSATGRGVTALPESSRRTRAA
ncbi:hypothetical protein [Embleya sp. AB8]|uniref:hypothetical protein n=1 Tax=Embleya sp. AB8 TaxID=3156304 RepID=UPI003C7635ED